MVFGWLPAAMIKGSLHGTLIKMNSRLTVFRIKVWQLDETNGTWSVEDDWKAHDAAVSK
ncbi:hypothetical protein MPER_07207, partial [Moniliophthora perniciosa FA553]